VIDGDTALGQQLLDVAVGQAAVQIPADRDRDHLPRDRKPAKTELMSGVVTRPVSPASRDRQTQQCHMNRRHMIDDHHGRTAGRATLLARAMDEIFGTHSVPVS
jgi:hypothetical protein